jgi:PEGA domain
VKAGDKILYQSGPIGVSSTHKASPEGEPVIRSTGDAAALELANSAPVSRTTTQATGQEAISNPLSSTPAKTVAQANVITNEPVSGLNNVAEIIVASNPAGATVEINGNAVGTTPVTLRSAANGFGFNLRVQKDGYRKWYIQTFATPGRQVITADLQTEAPNK